MSKRARIIAAIVALVIVVGVVASLALKSQGTGPEIDTAQASAKKLAVTVTASGKVKAGAQSDVYPPAAGTIAEVYVSDGETVTAGAKLAMLDTAPLELQVAQAKAALSQARAQLATVNQSTTGAIDLGAARAQVNATYRAWVAAKAQLDAIGNQAPSKAQVEAAEAATDAAYNAFLMAKAAYEAAAAASPNPSTDPTVTALAASTDSAYAGYLAAKAAEGQVKSTDLSAARAQAKAGVAASYAAWKGAESSLSKLQGASTSQQKAAAQMAIRQAGVALKLSQKNLDDATMVAPIDGVVIFNNAAAAAAAASGASSSGGDLGEGSPVSPAAAPFSVVDMNALSFTAEVDEADIDRIKVGMQTSVALDAFPNETFNSHVVRVNPVAQSTATGGTVFEAEIVLDDTGKDILLGMKGDATIEVSARDDALAIPVEALFSEGGTDYVYVVVSGVLKKTEITVGATTDTEAEVLSGLKDGDVVALSGSTQYADGMSVRIKK